MIDNLQSWNSYPKRSKSIIMFNNIHNVGAQYGDTAYLVIPYDDANFGICPYDDMWYCRTDKQRSLLGSITDFYTLKDINDIFELNNITDRSFNNLVDDIYKLLNSEKPLDHNMVKLGFVKNMDKQYIIDFLDDLYSPNNVTFQNKPFKVGSLDITNSNYTNEIWTDSKCLLYRIGDENSSLSELENKYKEFLNQIN